MRILISMDDTDKPAAKYATAAAEISALVEQLATRWTGIDWDTGPATLVNALEAGRAVDEDDLPGVFWPADGSHAAQRLTAQWQSLLSDLATGDDAELLERAKDLAQAEAAYVEERADSAAVHGRIAVDGVADGRWDDAIEAAKQAAAIEREFGDDPTWGQLEGAIRELPEFRAAKTAAANYQDDARSDDEIAADADRLAGEASDAEVSATPDPWGTGDRDAWLGRYAATYAAEIREWCAL